MTEMKREYYNSETLVTQNPEYCVTRFSSHNTKILEQETFSFSKYWGMI